MKLTAKVGYPLFAVLLLYNITVANALSPQEIAVNAFDSTVLLVMEDENSQPIGLGSGFFVAIGQIATNLHVVEGAVAGYAKLIGEKTKHNIEGITAIDAERDLVILKVDLFARIGASNEMISIGDSDTVQVGEPIYAVGNPQGLEGTFSQGIISSVRKIGTDKLLQITAPISPGSSGGPVLNKHGKVIGVSVATFHRGQNLNFAIPSNYLTGLRTQVGEAIPLSQAKLTKSTRSVLGDLGGRSAEGVTAYKFSREYSRYYDYSFSLRNRLRQSVKNIRYNVIFYDALGDPIDVHLNKEYKGTVPGGLAKRVTGSFSSGVNGSKTRVEFRILDFEMAEGN